MPTPPTNKGRKQVKVNALTLAKLVRLLLDGELNCQELAQETGLHYVTVLEYTRYMHREGAVHICNWEPDARGRRIIKVYKLGVGKDMRRPKMTQVQRAAAYRERERQKKLQMVVQGTATMEKSANGRFRITPHKEQPCVSTPTTTA